MAIEDILRNLNKGKFVNFSHHDEYSLRSGIGNISEIVPKLKESGGTHLCITNYNDVSEWVKLYIECKKHDLIPIFGLEASVNNFKPTFEKIKAKNEVRDIYYRDGDGEKTYQLKDLDDKQRSLVLINWHLVLIAKNKTGYDNLIKAHNDAQLNWFHDNPRFNEGNLKENAEGVVAIIPNSLGEIVYLIDNNRENEALAKYKMYKSWFEDVYIELAVENDEYYKDVNDKVIKFAQKHGLTDKLLIGINSHYTNASDEGVFKDLLRLRVFKGDKQHEVCVSPDMSFKTEAEVRVVFENKIKTSIFTNEVYNRCLVNSKRLSDGIKFIEVDTSVKMPNFENADVVIREKAYEGLRHIAKDDNPTYVKRLEYELNSVSRAGFTDYFLFLEDMCRWCKKNGVHLGVGRGSGGGSLLLYVLGIILLDPIKYNLLFERFVDINKLNEIAEKGLQVTGDDMADVDIDLSDRDKVIQYFRDKYGDNNICIIGTLNRFKNKSLLLDLGRMHKIDLSESYKITQGEMSEWDKDDENKPVAELRKKSKDFDDYLNQYPEVEKSFDRLRGGIQAFGQHAGGVIVSDVELTNLMPVKRIGENIVSCWVEGLEGRELGTFGFIKMDLLTINAMAKINDVIDLVNKRHGLELTMMDIPLEDPKVFKQISKGDNFGLWQLDGNIGKTVIKAMGGIKTFMDLATASALVRPSCLKNKFHEKFGERRSGKEDYSIVSMLEPFLGVTYGLPIFQEAAYQISHALAGFDIINAHKFMKTLYKGKMTKEYVPYWKEKFMNGCKPLIESGEISAEYPEEVFNELLAFQGYGFNCSHAVAYAHYTMFDAWLKHYYYPEYMVVQLNHADTTKKKDGSSTMSITINHAYKIGMSVSPPCINNSKAGWFVDWDGSLRMSFGCIARISKDTAEQIEELQPFKNFDDFMGRIDKKKCNKASVESLIFSGCFNCFADVPVVWNYWNTNYILKKTVKTDAQQMSFFFDDEPKVEETIYTKKQLRKLEIEAIGMSFNDDIVKKYKEEIKKDKTISTIGEIEAGEKMRCNVFCRIDKVTSFVSRNTGQHCKWMFLSDGIFNAKVFIKESDYVMNNISLKVKNIVKMPVSVSNEDRGVYFFNNNKQTEVFGKDD